jgi:hypothetical protein
MILDVLIDGDGRPVCSEMWPGNTAESAIVFASVDGYFREGVAGWRPSRSHV